MLKEKTGRISMRINLHSIKKIHVAVAALFVFSVVVSPLVARNVFAAATQSFVRFDRMKISTATTGTVCFMSATTATEATVKVTFPTGYTLSGTLGDWTVDTTNLAWPAGGTAWPSINTATNVTGQVVTFPSGDLTVGTLYCFNWTNSAAVQTKSSATSSNTGQIDTYDSGPALIDTAPYSTATITDDQIVVTATIPTTFSFALSGNTDALGTITTAAVASSPTPRTVTIDTNAFNGWMVWAKDSNAGLKSVNAGNYLIGSTTPGSNSTLSAGTEGYNTGVTQSQVGGAGTISVAAAFVGGLAGKGGGLDTSLRTLASSDGTADTAVLTLTNNAAIKGTTPAASDYTDTITVIGAGLF
ncbi:MAG: hypothetical protein H6797_00975 [Candidatus Nomurabacteria bacterium]|nr:MAG: hypothetical protein H6797_00975 [Candidatus Nomurabacteria bacterium]